MQNIYGYYYHYTMEVIKNPFTGTSEGNKKMDLFQ